MSDDEPPRLYLAADDSDPETWADLEAFEAAVGRATTLGSWLALEVEDPEQ